MRNVAILLGAMLLLSGCSGDQPAFIEEITTEHTVTLTDGRSVVCVTWKRGYAGGMSCDWEGAE